MSSRHSRTLHGFGAFVAALLFAGWQSAGAAVQLFVTSGNDGRIIKFDPNGNALISTATQPGGGTSNARGVTFGPDGNLYASRASDNAITRFDPNTLASLGIITVADGPYGLSTAGSNLVVNLIGNNSVARVDPILGTVTQVVAPNAGGLDVPLDAIQSGNTLYVSSFGSSNSATTGAVRTYDATTGASLGTLVAPGSGGLAGPAGLAIGPDGSLYVSSFFSNQVLRYNATTGAPLGAFVPAGSGGLNDPFGLRFGQDGNLYVASYGTNQVLAYNGTTGAFLGVAADGNLVNGGGLSGPTYLATLAAPAVGGAVPLPASASTGLVMLAGLALGLKVRAMRRVA